MHNHMTGQIMSPFALGLTEHQLEISLEGHEVPLKAVNSKAFNNVLMLHDDKLTSLRFNLDEHMVSSECSLDVIRTMVNLDRAVPINAPNVDTVLAVKRQPRNSDQKDDRISGCHK